MESELVKQTNDVESSDAATVETTIVLAPGPNAVDISPNNDGGVVKEILKEGNSADGHPLSGETVFVHYVGRLTDGKQFDSSRERGEYFSFVLGKGKVIKAWDIGVASMCKGEICKLYCKPEYAYGETGSGANIPPNATLVFEIELFWWEGEDLSPKNDKGIMRRKIIEGEGYSTPNEGAMVTVHLLGRHVGRVFEDREVTYPVGEGSEYGIVDGLEKVVEKLKKGEKSLITLNPQYAFGKAGNADLGIPADAVIQYEVTLKNFEKAKESWELDLNEKLEQAQIFKTKGTTYFKNGKYQLAMKQYKKVVEFIQHMPGLESEKEAEQKQLLLQGRLNLAICYLKMNKPIKARDECDKALELDPNNEKGLFRRGMARMAFNDVELAKKDFEAVLKVDANNKAAANQIIVCNRKLKDQYEKERKMYSNMFTKMSKPDGSIKSRKDVLENPGTWGEDDSNIIKDQANKSPDDAGDGQQQNNEEDRTKEQRFAESINSENIEPIP